MTRPHRPAGHGKVAAHAGITFAGLTSANVLAYVFYALVSRAIGVEPYGTFSALVAVVLILSTPALIAQMVVAKLASDLVLEPGAARRAWCTRSTASRSAPRRRPASR